MEERIACACGNRLYRPPADRDYACPACRSRLPRLVGRRRGDRGDGATGRPGREGRFAPSPRLLGRPVFPADWLARGSLVMGCLAAIFLVSWHLVLTPQARSSRAAASAAPTLGALR